MQEICISIPLVVTGVWDLNKSGTQHHRSLKLGSKLKYLNIISVTFNFHVKTSRLSSLKNLQSIGFAIIVFSVKYRSYEKQHSFLLTFKQIECE